MVLFSKIIDEHVDKIPGLTGVFKVNDKILSWDDEVIKKIINNNFFNKIYIL